VTFDNASGQPDASNTIYIGIKADLPIRQALIATAPLAD
jgi:hypothetical protein